MNTKKICITALGVALYVCVSMLLKIPIIAHISFDLGYIVLAVYCYYFGAISGAVVGGCGAVLVSLLASGWLPPGWMLGNIFIGGLCGSQYENGKTVYNIGFSIIGVIAGIAFIKTAIECPLYGIPFSVKIVSNGVAALMDATVMCIGVLIAPKLPLGKSVDNI